MCWFTIRLQWIFLPVLLATVTPYVNAQEYCSPESVGLQNGDHRLITSSSSDDSGPNNARYDAIQPVDSMQMSCWQPATTDVFAWMEVYFEQVYDVWGIQFQECGGTESASSNVMLNSVEYSLQSDGFILFQPHLDSTGLLFGPVNIDSLQFLGDGLAPPVEFWKPFAALHLRLNIGTRSKFRFEVLGCAQNSYEWYCDGGFIESTVSEGLVCPYSVSEELGELETLSYVADSEKAGNEAWRASFNESGGWRPVSNATDDTQCLTISFPHRVRVEGIIGKVNGQENLADQFYCQHSYDGSSWSSGVNLIFNSDVSNCIRRTYFAVATISLKVRVCWISPSKRFSGLLSVEILGCLNRECLAPLRINQKKINAKALVATSSNRDDQHLGQNAAVDFQGRLGLGWIPSYSDERQWFEVVMGNPHIIYAIVMQGCSSEEKWILSYKLGYRRPLQIYMQFVYEQDNEAPRQLEQTFAGSVDHNSFSTNVLPYAITTDVLRIMPITWQNDICLRLDVIAGMPDDCMTPIEPISLDQVSATKDDINYPVDDVFTDCWLGTDSGEEPYANWLQIDLFHDYLITAVHFIWKEKDKIVEYESNAYRINYLSGDQDTWQLYIDRNGNQNLTKYRYMELDHPFTANRLRISLAFGCLHITAIYGFTMNGVKEPNYCDVESEQDMGMESDQQLSRIYNDCPFPIGLESGKVNEHQVSASSSIDIYHSPNSGRLNHLFGWQAQVNTRDEWFQIEFGQRMIVTGLLVQGSDSCNLKAFTLKFGYPPDDNNEVIFYDYNNRVNNIEEFMIPDGINCTEQFILDPYIHANYIQVIPVDWSYCIGFRLELLGCNDKEVCTSTAGISSGNVADNSFTASSAIDAEHVPSAARLSSLSYSVTCWRPALTDDAPWISVHLPPTSVHTIVMRGCEDDLWVEKFTLSYSRVQQDSSADVLDRTGFIKEFSANINSYDLAYIEFDAALDDIVSLTIHPIKWSGGIAITFELIACQYTPCLDRLGIESGEITDDQIEIDMPGLTYAGSLRLYGTISQLKALNPGSGYGYFRISFPDLYLIHGTITLRTVSSQQASMFWIEYRYENETYTYRTIDGETQYFVGGEIQLVEITNLLERPIITNEVTFLTSNGNELSELQFEIIGCSLAEMGAHCVGSDRVLYDGFCFGTVESNDDAACHEIFYPGAEPAIIRSEDQMQFIRQTDDLKRDTYNQYIIGASSNNMGSLVWVDSTPVLLDNFRQEPDVINDNECVSIDGLDDQIWVLFDCDDQLSTSRATLCRTDLDECVQNNICSHGCVNTPGSYYCTCQPGYYSDGNACESGCIIISNAMEVEWTPLTGVSGTNQCYTVLSDISDETDASEICQQLDSELANSSISSSVVGFGSSTSCKLSESTSTIPLVTTVTESTVSCDPYACVNGFSISMCYDMNPNSTLTLDDGYGYIGCLHWPPFFNRNTEWTFEICVPSSKSIRIYFRDVSIRSLEITNGPQECIDRLLISDISDNRGSTAIAELCTSVGELTLLSRSNKISLSLTIGDLTSDVPQSIGFETFYAEIDCLREECDYGCGVESVFTADNGIISTPNFPQSVRDFANCEFTIRVKRNTYIEIEFYGFDIATNGDGSCKDTLEVLDGTGTDSLTGVRCGTFMPTVRSTTSVVVIVLVTGHGGESNGFEASYISVEIPGCEFGTDKCKRRNCNSSNAMIASVNYPHQYEPDCVMEWNIHVSLGSYVYFDILEIDILPGGEQCKEDFLRFAISQDSTNTDEVRPKLCQQPDQITSLSNYLRVVFETNGRDEGTGFLARYEERTFIPELINKNVTGSCPSGWDKYNEQCYSFQTADKLIDWNTAQSKCVAIGGNLTSISTYDEMQYIHSILINEPDAIGQYVYIGLMRELFGRQLFRWIDGRPASYMDWYLSSIYSSNEFEYRQPESSSIESCSAIEMTSVLTTDQWVGIACAYEVGQHFICEQPLTGYVNMESVVLKVPTVVDSSPCQSTHQFKCASSGDCIAAAFVCDGVIDCFDASDETKCTFSSCPDGYTMIIGNCVSLSLICDGRNDLRGGTDEFGCVFASCSDTEFQCGNGLCINKTLVCNDVRDCSTGNDELDCVNCATGFFQCHDGSCLPEYAVCDGTKDCKGRDYEDEPTDCNYHYSTNATEYCSESDVVCNNGACMSEGSTCMYDIDQYGIQVGCRDSTHLKSCEDFVCPDYMFKCPDSYCIPMRRRCDDIWDCPNGEDEKACSDYTCSDFYHCRSSRQCLSPLEVCDGVSNCPYADDEQFCDISCPSGCVCTGFVVQCSSTLTTADLELIPTSVRFLDLSGNLPTDTGTEAKRKKRTVVDDFLYILDRFPYLHTLDISMNNIESLNPGGFSSLINLKKLNLSGNAIVILEDNTFVGLTNLSILDVSNNGLERIDSNVFVDINNTVELYIGGNAITDVDADTFKYLSKLETLVSDDYKFCCLATATSCTPQPDEFSSCQDLMRVKVLRVFVWILGISAFVGNFCVIIWRQRKKQKNKVQGYLIQNLAVSDFFMGVYLLIIASADIYYRDNYVLYATQWRNSAICSIAGFLSVFSSEMSVYILTVITVDRYICIVFPFSRFRMRPSGTLRVLVIGWMLVFLISVIPLFGSDYFSNFYGSNAVCLALPITHQDVPAAEYSITFFLGVNLLSFLVIAICYLSMYISVKRSANKLKDNVIKNDSKKKELKMATKMAVIVLTDMFCWLPIIIMGILARGGAVKIPGDVYAWTAVFILPLNSAINPHLYTFSSYITLERKKKVVTSKNNTGTTPLSTPQPMKKLNNIPMWVVPENVHRKRQLLPYLRESSNQAVTVANRFKDSEGGGVKDEEILAIEKQYLEALDILRKCQKGQSKLVEQIKAVDMESKHTDEDNISKSEDSCDELDNINIKLNGGDDAIETESGIIIDYNNQDTGNTKC